MAEENQINEMFEFMKDNVATKEDLKGFATKKGLTELEERMNGKMNIKIDSLEGKLKTTMVSKAYLDDKLADLSSELGDRIYRKNELDKSFKKEVIIIFKKNSLCNTEEIERLNELI